MTASRRALLLSTAGLSGAVLASGVAAAPEAEADTAYPVVPGTIHALGSVSGSVQLDLSVADTFTCTVTGTTTFVFTYSGTVPTTPVTVEPVVILTQDAPGFRAVSFVCGGAAAPVSWMPAGAGPAVSMGGGSTSILSFLTPDFGATVYGQGAAGNGQAVYGDGSDGVMTLDGTSNLYPHLLGWSSSSKDYWLLRDIYPSALTLGTDVGLQLAGGGSPPFRVYCKGALTVSSGAAIWTLPNATAKGSTVGTNLSTGTLPPGASSPSGTKTAGAAGSNAVGGLPTTANAPSGYAVQCNVAAGGAGGAAGSYAGGAGGFANVPSGLNVPTTSGSNAVLPRTLTQAVSMSVTDGAGTVHMFTGGAGGGAGAGDGTNAGGGGGQGGPVILIYSSYSGTGVVKAPGGAGGKAAGTGGAGSAGGPGWIVELQN